MANKKKVNPSYFESIVGKEAAGKIGTYQESTGGGTPLQKGEKLKDHPEAKRVSQPRDEEGQFTYNAVNAKPLKYGPSRGTTLPPFLKGVNLNFAEKKKNGVSSVFDGKSYLSDIEMTPQQFISTCKEYLETEGGFKGLLNKSKSKVGAKSKLEKDMISKNEEGVVSELKISAEEFHEAMNKNKGKNKKKKNDFFKKEKPAPEKPTPEKPTPETPAPEAPAPEAAKEVKDFSDDDKKQAASNPQEFAMAHKDELKDVLALAKTKGHNYSSKKIVEAIASGKIKNFDSLKKKIEGIK